MFRHPASAVGSYSSGPPAAETVGTKSTGGFHQRDGSPCTSELWKVNVVMLSVAYLAGILLAEVDVVVMCEVSVLAGEVHLLPAQVAHKVLDGPAAAGLLLRGIRNLNTWKKVVRLNY